MCVSKQGQRVRQTTREEISSIMFFHIASHGVKTQSSSPFTSGESGGIDSTSIPKACMATESHRLSMRSRLPFLILPLCGCFERTRYTKGRAAAGRAARPFGVETGRCYELRVASCKLPVASRQLQVTSHPSPIAPANRTMTTHAPIPLPPSLHPSIHPSTRHPPHHTRTRPPLTRSGPGSSDFPFRQRAAGAGALPWFEDWDALLRSIGLTDCSV